MKHHHTIFLFEIMCEPSYYHEFCVYKTANPYLCSITKLAESCRAVDHIQHLNKFIPDLFNSGSN